MSGCSQTCQYCKEPLTCYGRQGCRCYSCEITFAFCPDRPLEHLETQLEIKKTTLEDKP